MFTSELNSGLVSEISVTVGDSNIKPSSCVRYLGSWFDSRIDMERHVNSVCKSCFGQIRQISHIRQFLTTGATKSLVNSLVTSRLDYCNALLYGVPKTILNKLKCSKHSCTRCDQDISFLSYNSCIERTSLASYSVYRLSRFPKILAPIGSEISFRLTVTYQQQNLFIININILTVDF